MTRALAVALLLLALLPHAAAADGGAVVARSTVDRTTMTLGDQVLFTVTVDLPPGYDLVDPGVPRAIGDFQVAHALTVLQTRLADGSARVELRYLVTTFELGPRRLPPVVVGYTGPNGERGEVRTQGGWAISVVSVVRPGEDASDVKPLKPPLPVPGAPGTLLSLVPAAGSLVLLLVLASVLALRLARRRRGSAVEATRPGAAREALDELERVAAMRLPEHGRTREHYQLVSAAVRRFAARRYGVLAGVRTARELRRDLERAGVPRAEADLLCEVLADAEAVRYEERVIYPARAHKTTADLVGLVRKSLVAEEYELMTSGAPA